MRRKWCYPYALVSFPSSIGKAIESCNFLISPSRSTWHRSDSRWLKSGFPCHILPEPAHTPSLHTPASVSSLQLIGQLKPKYHYPNFPLAQYAARYWVDHAKFRNVLSQIQEVIERLFNPAMPHFAAWIWLYDIDRYRTEPMSTMHPTRTEAVPLLLCLSVRFRWSRRAHCMIAGHSLDVNSKGGSHTTALHAASVKGHLQVISVLLRNDAYPDSRDHFGRVPLHRVSQGGLMAKSSLEIACLLINSGADVNVTCPACLEAILDRIGVPQLECECTTISQELWGLLEANWKLHGMHVHSMPTPVEERDAPRRRRSHRQVHRHRNRGCISTWYDARIRQAWPHALYRWRMRRKQVSVSSQLRAASPDQGRRSIHDCDAEEVRLCPHGCWGDNYKRAKHPFAPQRIEARLEERPFISRQMRQLYRPVRVAPTHQE